MSLVPLFRGLQSYQTIIYVGASYRHSLLWVRATTSLPSYASFPRPPSALLLFPYRHHTTILLDALSVCAHAAVCVDDKQNCT